MFARVRKLFSYWLRSKPSEIGVKVYSCACVVNTSSAAISYSHSWQFLQF